MRYAISDIHGCPETLRLALKEVDFQANDELFLLGDYIDRGPDSQGVLNFIWELEEQGLFVTCLRGNHEQMLLDFHLDKRYLYEWKPDSSNYNRTIDWMNALPYYHLTPGYILVHAGLDFSKHNPLDDTDAMMWERYWYGEIDRQWLGSRIIVHGHTPARMLEVKSEVKKMNRNQYACIDSGCSQQLEGMGYLTVLNLDTKQATFVRRVD